MRFLNHPSHESLRLVCSTHLYCIRPVQTKLDPSYLCASCCGSDAQSSRPVASPMNVDTPHLSTFSASSPVPSLSRLSSCDASSGKRAMLRWAMWLVSYGYLDCQPWTEMRIYLRLKLQRAQR